MTEMTRKWSGAGTGHLTDAEVEARRLEKKGVFQADLDEESGKVSMSKEDFKSVMSKLGKHKKRSQNLIWTLGITVVAGLAACGVMLGVTMSANELSKESHVKNVQFTDSNGKLVETANPISYAALTDLPKLPLAAIDAIDALTFTTVDSKLHSYKKAGLSWGATKSQLTVVFSAAGRSMEIDSDKRTAAFIVKDPNTGKVTSVAVVLPNSKVVDAARRQLAAAGHTEGRCVNDACLHTMDEMLMLHGLRPSEARSLGAASGVSYAEVLQDGAAALSGSAAVDAANAMLDTDEVSKVLGSDKTYKVSFNHLERCDSYGLKGCNTPTSANVSAAPYAGTVAVDGTWYFKDAVTYEKDASTLKVSIAYGHDSIDRQHVIVQSTDGSKFLQYDLVNDEKVGCVASKPAAAEVEVAVADRRLSSSKLTHHEKVFHAHVRKMLPGFGHVHFGADESRNLSEDEEETVTVRVSSTDSEAAASTATVFLDSADALEDVLGDKLTTAAKDTLGDNVALSGTVEDAPEDAKASSAILQDPSVVIVNSTLSFPDVSGCGSATSVITKRADLDISVATSDDDARRLKGTSAEYHGDVKETIANLEKVTKEVESQDMKTRALKKQPTTMTDAEHEKFVESLKIDNTERELYSFNWWMGYREFRPWWQIGRYRAMAMDKVHPVMPWSKRHALVKKSCVYQLTSITCRLRGWFCWHWWRGNSNYLYNIAVHAWIVSRSYYQWVFGSAGNIENCLARYAVNRVRGYGIKWGRATANAAWCNAIGCPAKDGSFARTNGWLYANAPRTYWCRVFNNEIRELINNYDSMLYYLTRIDDAAKYLQDGVASVDKLYWDTHKVHAVIIGLMVICAMAQFLPGIGGAFAGFLRALQRARPYVWRVNRYAAKFRSYISRYQVRQRLDWVQTNNEKAMTTMTQIAYNAEKYLIGGVILIDQLCPSGTTNHFCYWLWRFLYPVNDILNQIKHWLNVIASVFRTLAYWCRLIKLIVFNWLWNVVMSFFNAIYNLCKPFLDFLYRRICVRVPIPEWRYYHHCFWVHYPCGVHWCHRCYRIWCGVGCSCGWRGCNCWNNYCTICIWYVCGIRWCSYRACIRIWYLVFVWRYYCFSVWDIIRGVLSLISIIMNALNWLVGHLLRFLRIPSFIFNLGYALLRFILGLLPNFSINFYYWLRLIFPWYNCRIVMDAMQESEHGFMAMKSHGCPFNLDFRGLRCR